MMTVKEIKKNEYFTLKQIENPSDHQVYVKLGYDRSTKKYEIAHFDDINNTRFVKGSTPVYTEFVF